MPVMSINFPDDVHAAVHQAARDDDRPFSREVVAICRANLTERGLLPADQAPSENQ